MSPINHSYSAHRKALQTSSVSYEGAEPKQDASGTEDQVQRKLDTLRRVLEETKEISEMFYG